MRSGMFLVLGLCLVLNAPARSQSPGFTAASVGDGGVATETASAESLQRGQELLAKAAEAIGAQSIAGLKGWHRKQTMSATIKDMALKFSIEETAVPPDRMRVEQTTPFGSMTRVVDGLKGWSESPRGRQEVGAPEAARAREAMETELLRVLRDRAQLSCQALGPTLVDGQTFERVQVTGAGSGRLLYYLDPVTGLPAIEEMAARSPLTGEPVTQQKVFGEYGLFGGLKLAKTVTVKHDGAVFATGTLDAFELNPVVTAETFE